MITHTDHLLHAVDEEGCNEENPGGADSNSPSDGHLVVTWSPGGHLLNKMRIMCSEVGLGDEDVEKVWSSLH